VSLHDDYARLTLYELVFPDAVEADAFVESVLEEARDRGADPADLASFVSMGSVARFVDEVEAEGANPGAIHRFGALLYHAVHFQQAGRPLYLMSTHVARYLVEGSPGGRPEPPTPAGYLQLPQHLFWAEPEPGRGAESVDGLHWTVTPSGLLHVLLVTGLRPDRAGASVIPLPVVPLAEAPAWLDASARPYGDDFSSTLPGSELDRLHAFQTAGEVLKLLGRLFAYVAATPDALVPGRTVADAGGPAPSTFPSTRIVLDA